MRSPEFWELAVCVALLTWFFGHIEGHLRAMRRDQTVTLNSVLHGAIWLYHWFAWCPWLIPIYYGYRTIWWHGLVLAVAAVALRFIIGVVEGGIKLQRHAWAISLVGLVAIPVLAAASFVVLVQAVALFTRCTACAF
jgi:hypothetical protein